MRALFVLLAGCAVTMPPLPQNHPADPQAQVGRLAGPPASLRTGVVTYDDVPASRPDPAPHHHHTP